MGSIVLELQQDAMQKSGSVSDLLRKAYTVARKLKLSDFAAWAKTELEGYNNETLDAIPEYRVVRGRLRALNPYSGWIPAELTGDLSAVVESTKAAESVPEIEHLLAESSEYLVKYLPHELSRSLGRLFQLDTQYQLLLSRSDFEGILHNLRQAVLDWALQLEEDGILGDGIQFSEDEKKTAGQNQYHVTVTGAGSQIQIQQNTVHSTQQLGNQGVDVEQLKTLVSMIREHVAQYGLEDIQQRSILEALDVVEEQSESSSPNYGLIKKSLLLSPGI
ncbi:AbiTii domain-containing protein [Alicyclobacillus suci]|uniref:AbiTii domain-containing protein n=1 Tax=Alicyclobacillus suci TaxID=2816080 RepID=UPI001A8EA9C2|nr:hypothetical protein [Alicyclobacillus suci]